MDQSIHSEYDGFVLVSKSGLAEDDTQSVGSDRSSLCLVDDPAADPGLFEESDEEGQGKGVVLAATGPDSPGKTVLDSDASEQDSLMNTPEPSENEQPLKVEKTVPPKPPAQQSVSAPEEPKYTCQACRVDIAALGDIVWEGYMGANVPAILFRDAKNTEPIAEARQQQLSTGVFLVQDVKCRNCSARLGWTYLKSFSAGQEYKVGTTIVQRSSVKTGK